MIVLGTVTGAHPASRLRRRPSERPASEPGPIQVARATIVDVASPLEREGASAWLRGAGEADLEQGVAVLNWALQAHRIAAGDHELVPVDRRQALGARIGFGAGEEVAEGRWSEVRELAWEPGRRRRRRMPAPEGRLAAILTGREQALVCEELALRARLDLDTGRMRHAALQMLIVLDATIAELASDGPTSLAERIDDLRGRREPIGQAAQAALSGEPSAAAQAAVEEALERVEAALRARAAMRG